MGPKKWLRRLAFANPTPFVSAVPFLKNVRYLLSLLPIIFLFYIVTTISGWNLSVTLIDFYRLRV